MSEEIKDDVIEITPTEATEVEVETSEDSVVEEVVSIGEEVEEYIPNINDFIPYGDIIPEGIE